MYKNKLCFVIFIPTELNSLSNELLTAPMGVSLKFTSGPLPIKNGIPVKVPKFNFKELLLIKLKLYCVSLTISRVMVLISY